MPTGKDLAGLEMAGGLRALRTRPRLGFRSGLAAARRVRKSKVGCACRESYEVRICGLSVFHRMWSGSRGHGRSRGFTITRLQTGISAAETGMAGDIDNRPSLRANTHIIRMGLSIWTRERARRFRPLTEFPIPSKTSDFRLSLLFQDPVALATRLCSQGRQLS